MAFWLCLALVFYVYAGYLVVVFALAAVMNRRVCKVSIEPTVTVVISAFNEEAEIEHTVMNKLRQDYPQDRLEVIVISDGSTDRTNEIVRSLAARSEGRVRLLLQEPRQGKTQALNMAMKHVASEIVVFADANSIYASGSVRSLVSNFADPSVGYVTGRMIYTNPEGSGIGEGSGAYMSYENILRGLETNIGSIVGVDGGIDAVRRQLYVPMRADQLPDFILPLSVIEQGKRVVYDPQATVFESALSSATAEFRMRVRVSLRALWGLRDKYRLLNPMKYPLFSWQLLSHKVFRYLAFFPLIGLLAFNALLVTEHDFYLWFLLAQLTAYAAAGLGYLLSRSVSTKSKLLAPYYFVILNAACVLAFWKFLQGQKMVLWIPRGGA